VLICQRLADLSYVLLQRAFAEGRRASAHQATVVANVLDF
jgi:hypothetical protein